ncbi:MAG: SH3 domain-containing protein [Clostridia bacterium]|nr:SH3 domain-containing protein [Clostridia bacterium]
MKRLVAIVSVIVMCLMVAVASAGTVYINADNGKSVNVRSTPIGHCNNKIDGLAVGTPVEWIRREGDWSLIRFTHSTKKVQMEGYVMNRYITTNKNGAIKNTTKNMKSVTPFRATVTPSKPSGFVNVRAYPTKESRSIAKFYQGRSVAIVAMNNTWAKIYDPATKMDGYMMLRFLKY